jgi:predicted dienelactone hydrolase
MRTRSAVTLRACALLLSALAGGGCISAARAASIGAIYKVGVTQERFIPRGPYRWRAAQTRALLATVWYPAAATAREQPQWIGTPGKPLARAGEAAPGAALARRPERFPLIVISHGTGGSALAMAWLGARLASHGYIAVAVNHPGNNALEPYTAQGFTLWWLRAKDLSAVIDGMLSDHRFAPRIDSRRIGAAGFSLGGYTMVEIAGGRTSPALFAFCSAHPHARRCADPPEFPGLVNRALTLLKTSPSYRAAVRGASASYRDPRVRAILAIAPANGVAFVPASLERISIPVEIVAGSADVIEPVNENARYFATHIPGSRFTLVPGVGHYTFFATCTALGKRTQPELCDDGPGINRRRIHSLVAQLAVKFFATHLR